MKHPRILRQGGALPLVIGLGMAGGLASLPQALASCSPRMQRSGNPCAAHKPMMKKAGSSNPCAAHQPMMKKANPCNPCAASKPMMKKANPCNPCAAHQPMTKKATPCNPCAAHQPMTKKATPCNPCAAHQPMMKKANPCNPCAASKATGRQGSRMNPQALQKTYMALLPTLRKSYQGGAHPVADGRWADWKNFATAPYAGSTHGGRYLVNHANPVAAKVYGQYEKLRAMPTGGIIAKPSFTFGKDGKPQPGPLFIMEKMPKGFNAATRDWRYAMIMPGGETFGITGGRNAQKVAFCAECHNNAEQTDALLFLPRDVRLR